MATYVNDLRLKEIGTGESSGTWGTETNTNLELIAEAFSFGTEAITTNADTHTTTIADGSTDPGRSLYLKYTGTLDSACTITIGPNTVSKLWFIENGTSGSQNIIISQGSGANITIPPGDVKAVYSDGAGSGAAVVDAFASLNVVDLKVQDDLTVTDDATIGGTLGVTGIVTLTDDLIIGDGKTIGSASDVDAMTIASNGQVTFSQTLIGTALDISGDIDVDGTTNLDVVDIDGAVDMASTLAVGGVVTANAGVVVDNITIDGTEIDLSSGDLTLDSAGDIILDADGGDIFLKDAGTTFGELTNSSTDFIIKSTTSDKDIVFRGNDGGSTITALTLDMSDAGKATFRNGFLTTGTSHALGSGLGTDSASLEIGPNRSDSGNAFLDLVGDTTYTDYGARFIRSNTGANTNTSILHRGTGRLQLKTQDAGAISFSTSDTERMRIDSSGNVGIGTSSPSFGSGSGLEIERAGIATIRLQNSNSKSVEITQDSDFTIASKNSGSNILLMPTSSVGIGTASPLGKLSIQEGSSGGSANSNADGLVIDNTGKTGITILTPNDSEGLIFFADPDDDNIGRITYNHSTNAMGFVTNNSTALTVDSSGNVGIGATSPTDALHVIGGINVQDTNDPLTLERYSASSNGPFIFFQKSRNATVGSNTVAQSGDSLGGLLFKGADGDEFIEAARIEAKIDGTPGNNDMPGRLVFSTTPDGSASISERMRINSSGNVGINTSSPTEQLNVAGSTHITGSGTFPSSGSGIELIPGSTNNFIQTFDRDNSAWKNLRIKSNQIELFTAGSERMRIDSSGNVGISNTGPAAQLHIGSTDSNLGTTSGDELENLRLQYDTANTDSIKFRAVRNGDGNTWETVRHEIIRRVDNTNMGAICLGNAGSDTITFREGTNERARIDGSGNFLIATTSNSLSTSSFGHALLANGRTQHSRDTNGSGVVFDVFGNAGQCRILGDGDLQNTNNSYGAVSDVRLKENIVDTDNKLDILNKVRIVDFNFIEKEDTQTGVIAQELEELLPDLVSTGEDGFKAVKYSRFVPMLIKAVQEQQEQIESLTSEIAILKEK